MGRESRRPLATPLGGARQDLWPASPVNLSQISAFQWEGARDHPSGLYFGASIAALRHLAAAKGYSFVGTNSNGINASFVHDDFAGPVRTLIEDRKAYPSRYRGGRDSKGQLTFTAGLARLDLIRECLVYDVETGRTLRLLEIDRLYSDAWLAGMT